MRRGGCGEYVRSERAHREAARWLFEMAGCAEVFVVQRVEVFLHVLVNGSPFIIYSYLYPQVGIQIMRTDTRSLTKAHAIGVSLRHSRDWYLLISIEVEVLGRRSPCVVIGRSLSASASHFVLNCLAWHVNERHPCDRVPGHLLGYGQSHTSP